MASSGFTSLLWFIVIVAMIPLALWLLRRTPAGARFSGAGSNALLRSVAVLPLSAGQRVVTIEVGQGDARRWLVLGVTPQAITTLHTMEAQADVPGATAPALPAFANIFAKLRQSKEAAGGR